MSAARFWGLRIAEMSVPSSLAGPAVLPHSLDMRLGVSRAPSESIHLGMTGRALDFGE